MQHGILVTALEAINTRTEFTVYYHPRISPSGFIVAYDEFMELLKVNYSTKTRVEMIFDEGGEDPGFSLKKFSGIIIGKEDVDPKRWPGSEWRCLKVCWDATSSRHVPFERVSPWSIQSLDSVVPHQQSLVSLGQNRSMPFNPMSGYNHLGGLARSRNQTSHSVDFSRKSTFPVPLAKMRVKNYYYKIYAILRIKNLQMKYLN